MCPGRADITAMRSARNTASWTSCVTKMTVLRERCQMRRSSPCIRLRVCASSAPNGSSIKRMRGSIANVRAIVAWHSLFFEPVEDVLHHRLPWKEGEMLEDDAAVGAGPGDRLVFDPDHA